MRALTVHTTTSHHSLEHHRSKIFIPVFVETIERSVSGLLLQLGQLVMPFAAVSLDAEKDTTNNIARFIQW